MKKILLLLFLTSSVATLGQSLDKTVLIGKWITSDLTINFGDTKPKNKDVIKELKKGFINSEFDFKKNGKFYIKFSKGKPAFMGELAFLNDKNWKLENNKIKIGTTKDKFSLMHIVFEQKNGKTYFIIPGMRLEMKKG